MHFSFWEKKYFEEKADILILGGGITGVSAAISIKEKWPQGKVVIVERSMISQGASTKNAGFSCFGSPTEIWDDIDSMGVEQSMKIIEMRWAGLERLKQRLATWQMDYQACGGYELFEPNTWKDKLMEERLHDLNNLIWKYLGLKDVFQPKTNSILHDFDDRFVWNPYEGSLNPVLMMGALQKKAREAGVVFRLGLEVDEIDTEANIVVTKEGLKMPFGMLCVCTNGFTSRFFNHLKVVPARNQVLITKPLHDIKFQGCYHFDKGYFYFRNVENRILLGGGRNHDLAGELTDQFGNTVIIQQVLLDFLEKIHPGGSDHVEHWWSGILGIGPEKEPIITWVNDRVLCGVRLGGMGVALGSWMGDSIAEEVLLRLGYKK